MKQDSADVSKIRSKLELLYDQAQISVDERNRLRSMDMEPTPSTDHELENSLQALAKSIQDVQQDKFSIPDNKTR